MVNFSKINKEAKASLMASVNGYTNGLEGCVYLNFVDEEPTVFNQQSSPLEDGDDLYFAVFEAEKAGGWVVATSSTQPARLFSTFHKAMVFYYRLLNEVDELKLTTYEEDYTPLEDNEAVYRYVTREALL